MDTNATSRPHPQLLPRPALDILQGPFRSRTMASAVRWGLSLILFSVARLFSGLGSPAFSQSQFEMTPEVERLIRAGQLDMYNCNFDSSGKNFEELIRRFPDHPVGYMYKAEVEWWKGLRDPGNKALEKLFLRYTQQAIERGEALIRKDPKDFYAQLFLASTYGNKTRYCVTVSKSYLGAMRAGLKGHFYNENALALKPDCVDCLIGSGSYNYFTGSLPAVIKPFAWMLGARGDREKGLKELEKATEKGEFGQTEAKTVLLGVYFSERRHEDYRKVILKLIDQYPPNHVFYMWLVNHCIRQSRLLSAQGTALAQLDEGIRFLNELLARDAGTSTPGISRHYAFYEKGRLELEKKAPETAIASFSRAIELGSSDKSLLARAHLYRGLALDLKGDRDSALKEYRVVLGLPNVDTTQKYASRFSRNPYRGRLD